MNWKRMKGMIKVTNQCPRCHGEFPDEEYDQVEDLCLYCMFPEATKARPVPVNHDSGFERNITNERELLDNLENIPLKQSKQAKKAYNDYKNRNYKDKKRKAYK